MQKETEEMGEGSSFPDRMPEIFIVFQTNMINKQRQKPGYYELTQSSKNRIMYEKQ